VHDLPERFVNTQAPWIVPAAPVVPFARTPSWLLTQLAGELCAVWRAANAAGTAATTRVAATMPANKDARVRLMIYLPLLDARGPTLWGPVGHSSIRAGLERPDLQR
jgi:hypothetical protein